MCCHLNDYGFVYLHLFDFNEKIFWQQTNLWCSLFGGQRSTGRPYAHEGSCFKDCRQDPGKRSHDLCSIKVNVRFASHLQCLAVGLQRLKVCLDEDL